MIKENKVLKEIIEWVLCFAIAFALYLVINYFFGTVTGVRQVSMKPTTIEGDKLLIQRPTIFKKKINYGDIITFESPIDPVSNMSADPNDVKSKYQDLSGINSFLYHFVGVGKLSYIKRVIGLPGDHIVVAQDGYAYRNNEKLVENYLKDGTTNQNGVYTDVTVPDGYVFVMGDNRLESKDSRIFGCIPESKVDGYVITRVWPLSKFGKLK
ncbi:MAG: signal peptidase I [Clostridia bacterium]|nr:signal peptidase I [Clostridia bacterium]